MRRIGLALVLVAVFLVTFAGACGSDTNTQLQQDRKASVKQRSAIFRRAEAKAPTPTNLTNFPQRVALAEFTRRQDLVNHPWYVYILGMNGNTVAYYVAKTAPINACNFLSSTEAIDASDHGMVILTAPSLDGMYYGGAGASSGCDSWFWEDYASSAIVQIRGVGWYTSDRPLRVDADPIKVR